MEAENANPNKLISSFWPWQGNKHENTSYLTEPEPELQKTLGIKSVDEKVRSAPCMSISSEQTETNPFAKNKKGWKYNPFAKTKKFSNSSIARNNNSEKNPRYSIKKEN